MQWGKAGSSSLEIASNDRHRHRLRGRHRRAGHHQRPDAAPVRDVGAEQFWRGDLMPAAVPRVAYACGICAATFYRRAKEAERNGPPKYCSMKCRGLSMRRREEVVCSECGDSFERASAEIERRRGPRAWCSWDCFRAYQIKTGKSYPKIGGRHAHRIVGERIAGRKLGPHDIVHHRDENRRNYAEHNLEITNRPEHSRHHNSGVVRSDEYKRRMSESIKRSIAVRRAAR